MTRTLERRLADFAKELDAASERASRAVGYRPLPEALPVGLAASRPSWRRRTAAMTAVAAALLVVVAMVRFAGDERGSVNTDPADAPTESLVVDPATAPGFFSTQGTAEGAVQAYLVDRLDRPVEEIRIERLVPPAGPAAPGVGFRWSLVSAAPTSGGTVVVRRGPNDWWDIVEAQSAGVSIDMAARHAGEMTVEYSGPDGAELRLILQDIGDNILAESTCSDGHCTSIEEVPEVPVVLRVQLIQAGLPVTFAELRVDPRSTDDFTTTTLAPGAIDLSDLAGSAATQFMGEVLGDPSTVESIETSEPFGGGPATGTVSLVTSSGATVEVDVQCDVAGEQCTVLGLSSPGFRVNEGDRAEVTSPVGGFLTITGLGDFDPTAATLPDGEVMLADTRVEAGVPLVADLVESSWLRMDLVTDEGRILRYLRPR
jgi:hypothetical protein